MLHVIEAGRIETLDKCRAAFFLDGAQTHGAIRARGGRVCSKKWTEVGNFFVAIYQIYSFNVISELEVRQETYFNFLHGASAEWPENAE